MTDHLLDRLLPHDRLRDTTWRGQLADAYASAQPYPHVCIDNLFDDAVLRRVVEEFPHLEAFGVRFSNERELKYATRSEDEIPSFSKAFIHALNSAPFIDFLEEVTGIKGLIPDPHLVGGGFHALGPGGKLSVHTDFNFHSRLRLDRRVNVLIYLNEDWPEAYGGHFEAWREHGERAEARYLPIFNRLLAFTTTDFSFHGNPDPVTCPTGRVRKSIAMYYYSNGRPKAEWSGLNQTTRFMDRPGETVGGTDPLWYRVARAAPRPMRVWFSRNWQRRLRG